MIVGLHHLRLPVSDSWQSRDWYMDVLGFLPLLDVTEESSVVGVILRHPQGLILGLHQDAERAESLSGFSVLGLALSGRDELEHWERQLTERAITHGPVLKGHLGWYMDLPDPDGIVVRIHSGEVPYTEEA